MTWNPFCPNLRHTHIEEVKEGLWLLVATWRMSMRELGKGVGGLGGSNPKQWNETKGRS